MDQVKIIPVKGKHQCPLPYSGTPGHTIEPAGTLARCRSCDQLWVARKSWAYTGQKWVKVRWYTGQKWVKVRWWNVRAIYRGLV